MAKLLNQYFVGEQTDGTRDFLKVKPGFEVMQHCYAKVVGPFKSVRGALYFSQCPYVSTVEQAESIASAHYFKAFYLPVGSAEFMKLTKPTLREAQEFVGGYIEVLKGIKNNRVCSMIVRDEKRGLEVNYEASKMFMAYVKREVNNGKELAGGVVVPIYGNAIVLMGWKF